MRKKDAVTTYDDWFLFQVDSSSNAKSQARTFLFIQNDEVNIFFALTKKKEKGIAES